MAQIVINGNIYSGRSISVSNGDIIIDSNRIVIEEKIINITIDGDIDTLRCGSGTVTVNGTVGEVETGSGDVTVRQDVQGNIRTGSGDVEVRGSVSGSVKTGSGDICHR